jgi:hypothetical protein
MTVCRVLLRTEPLDQVARKVRIDVGYTRTFDVRPHQVGTVRVKVGTEQAE